MVSNRTNLKTQIMTNDVAAKEAAFEKVPRHSGKYVSVIRLRFALLV